MSTSNRIWPYAAICSLIFFLLLFTRSQTLNDTVDYARDVQSSWNCPSLTQCQQLWDAGHLLWRPLARILMPPLRPVLVQAVGDNTQTDIILLLIILNVGGIAASGLLLYSILINQTKDEWISLFLTGAFLCTNEILCGIHSGTSYGSGLAFLFAAVWLLQRSPRTDGYSAVLAGMSAALSVAFWFPYLVVIPALICLVLLNQEERRLKSAAVAVLAGTAVGLALFGTIAYLRGVHSVSALQDWLLSSGHGTQQNRNLIRSLFGLPKSFLDLGDFGIRVKQFLFRDPYADVKLAELFRLSFWKICLFYWALGGMVWLCRAKQGRKAIITLAVGLLGNMALAIVFEGGSPERYLPLYPFFFMAAALTVCLPEILRIARIAIILLGVLIIIGNVPVATASRINRGHDQAADRVSPLLPLRPGSIVCVLADDSLFLLGRDAPFHKINQRGFFEPRAIYLPMMHTAYWKHDFAKTVLLRWKAGSDVWVTTRVWSETPKQEWNWVEGDDPNLKWTDLVGYFKSLDHGPLVGADDGFFLLLPSERNQSLLTSLASE